LREFRKTVYRTAKLHVEWQTRVETSHAALQWGGGKDLVAGALAGGSSASEMDSDEHDVSVERLCCSECLLYLHHHHVTGAQQHRGVRRSHLFGERICASRSDADAVFLLLLLFCIYSLSSIKF
jgi:hypothetical protein